MGNQVKKLIPLGKKELLEKINTEMNYKDLEIISDQIMDSLFNILQEGNSFQYNDLPLIKTKISKPNSIKGSSRILRNDRIICTIKIKL